MYKLNVRRGVGSTQDRLSSEMPVSPYLPEIFLDAYIYGLEPRAVHQDRHTINLHLTN